MKVKIKKDGKQKTYNLINSWSDVTLEKWLQLIDIETGSKTKEAEETIAALSDMPKELIKQLSLKDASAIMEKIGDLQANENSSLKRIIEIDDVEYGFHPNLDEITLGEYADLETFIKNGIEQHMPEVMAILYRKVTEQTDSGVYTIEAYGKDLTIRAEQMKKMSAEQVQSALVFFWHFVSVLSMTSESSLMQMLMEMKEQLQQNPLPKSGDGLESSTDYAEKR
tara:strand:- start:340 stop:1011 length:672 start_codon:yes stop_codon:yes gene_type:complete